ncbi:PDZ domain-containing protein [Methylobacillus sp.]|uniref:PDZ domain-containing protein n=1 Tax=Methylobacillus sp. TaxID=56818 RepID=UPI002FE418F6
MRPYFIILLLALLAACSKPIIREPEPERPVLPESKVQVPPAEDNPYALHYEVRQLHGVKLSPNEGEPVIYKGGKEVDDYQRLLNDGYAMLGYSSFEAGEVLPSRALAQAMKIKAGAVVVYTRPIQTINGESKGEQLSNLEQAGNRELYSYFATYWSKLMPPSLGVHVMRRNEDSPEPGLTVLAVVTGSPAAQAGVAVGDVLLSLAGEILSSAEELQEVEHLHAGEEVALVLRRVGGRKHFSVTLGRAD